MIPFLEPFLRTLPDLQHKPVLARNGKRVIYLKNMVAMSCYLLWLVFPACFRCVSIASRAELASLARALRSLSALFITKNMVAMSCHLLWLVFPAFFTCVSIASRADRAAQRSRKKGVVFRNLWSRGPAFSTQFSIENPPILDSKTH